MTKKKRSLNQSTSLPHPTVEYRTDPYHANEAAMRGVLSNPVHVGIPPFSRLVSDEAWIKIALELIQEEGVEQFLVNMLYMLRISMVDTVSPEAIPSDSDGPWPDKLTSSNEEGMEEETEFAVCSHDGLPMVPVLGVGMVCVGAYLTDHLQDSRITDLITEPFLTLVFQNGHTLPLLCPTCSDSLHIEDLDKFLNEVNGLSVIGMEWASNEDGGEDEALLLLIGQPGDHSTYQTIPIHLTSVIQLTCPESKVWHEGD